MKARALLAAAIASTVVIPQIFAQEPSVTAVLNDANGDARLSPSVRAKIQYTNATPLDGRHFPEHNETVTIRSGAGTVQVPLEIAAIEPGLFARGGWAAGPPVGYIVREAMSATL